VIPRIARARDNESGNSGHEDDLTRVVLWLRFFYQAACCQAPFPFYMSVTPSVVNRASGFLKREACICLERTSIRAGFSLPETRCCIRPKAIREAPGSEYFYEAACCQAPFSLKTSVTPSIVNRASGFLKREACICLERTSIRAGFFLPET